MRAERLAEQMKQDTAKVHERGGVFGAESCKTCHEPQYENWLKTKHAEAMTSLVETEPEILFDCIGCHSVGYGSTFLDTDDVGYYANVQCESCHGTNAQHAEDPEKHPFRKINKNDCLRCHNKEVLGTDFSYYGQKSKVQCPKGD